MAEVVQGSSNDSNTSKLTAAPHALFSVVWKEERLGVLDSTLCTLLVTFARGPLSPKTRFLGMLPIFFIRRVVLGQESSIMKNLQ